MRITFERSKLGPATRPAVVSIGVFDGVHLGHQAVLARNVECARELDAESTLITFRRHPKQLLLGRGPKTLTTLDHRLQLFERAGIEHTLALAFDEELRQLSAEDFVRQIAVSDLGVKHFVLGFDSRFGRNREGTAQLIESLGFSVEVVPGVMLNQRPISSTAIREATELGHLELASEMLGRPVSVIGKVVQGKQLGRTIGFPTANLDLHHELHPPSGVYACRAFLLGEGQARVSLPAVANIGIRPTVEGDKASSPTVEVHLIDFDRDLYGQRMELDFVAHLRSEERFSGLEELKAQITRDVDLARTLLSE
jgi:riboflavin kinase/FMN adenylyltransferase